MRQRHVTLGGCLRALFGLVLVLALCFVIGIASQAGWQGISRVLTAETPVTPTVPPTRSPAATEQAALPTQAPTVTTEPTPVPPTATATVAMVLAPVPPTATPDRSPQEYTIREGDTLSSIAERFGVSIDALTTANPDVDQQFLPVGEDLIIPTAEPGGEGDDRVSDEADGEPTPGGSQSYVVQEGDTLYSIARRFGLNPENIVAANPAIDPDFLSVGDRLVIPER